MTTVLKLGGSVITEKDEAETVDDAALSAAAAAVGGAVDSDDSAGFVVVHGGGSFGHHHAAEHGVSSTAGTHDDAAVRAIHGAMKRLNAAVVDALVEAGVHAVPVHPLSCASRDEAGTLALPATQVERLLGEGFVPVLHGDVIAHEGVGATVLSGDDIVVSLAASLGASRVGLCSTVAGVLDDRGNVVSEITAFDEVADVLGDSEATDVTGGMAGKVRTLLSLDAPAAIFGPDDLSRFLAGEHAGTLVHAE
jgi:isopentenyl phosphate kinase